jgi:hypothetical protein
MKSTTTSILILKIIGNINDNLSYDEYVEINRAANDREFTNFYKIFKEVYNYSNYYVK